MNPGKHARYYAAIRYLESLNNMSGSYQKTDLTAHPRPEMYLERMRDLLGRLGAPQNGFKYVHITGTAGKGSVSSMVQAALISKKKKSGLFTSPFTVSTIEKIQVGKKYIDPESFADILERIKPHIDAMAVSGRHGMPSYFEIIFAIALCYFREEKCEYAVLEVGLGGRYDATNIIERPLVTAITNIGLDHTQVLGSTVEEIARDKSGIIKKGSAFFTTESDPRLLSIFKKECERTGASYHACEVDGLDHIQRNRLLAAAICMSLGIIQNPQGISVPVLLPARFEVVEKAPQVIIDGAHNASKIDSTVSNLKKVSYKKLILVIAISADKDWRPMMKILLPLADTIYVTRFISSGRPCVDPRDLMRYAEGHGFKAEHVHFHTDPIQAFHEARKHLSKSDLLLVAGSFYLAGDIRALYCPEELILRQRNSDLP